MPVCPQCGATYFVAAEATSDAHARRTGTQCPVCVLRRAPPEESLPDWVYRSARTALSFDSTDDLCVRIRTALRSEGDADADAAPDADDGPLRKRDLERLVRSLEDSPDPVAGQTNRELRARIADAVGADVSPASSFRKDTLVDVTLCVLERARPPTEE